MCSVCAALCAISNSPFNVFHSLLGAFSSPLPNADSGRNLRYLQSITPLLNRIQTDRNPGLIGTSLVLLLLLKKSVIVPGPFRS